MVGTETIGTGTVGTTIFAIWDRADIHELQTGICEQHAEGHTQQRLNRSVNIRSVKSTVGIEYITRITSYRLFELAYDLERRGGEVGGWPVFLATFGSLSVGFL